MRQKARLSDPISLFILEARSFPPMPILEKGNEVYIQAIPFIKRCFGEKWRFFLDNRAQTTQNTILDVLILLYILFRLIFVLNLSFPYITCNFAQK
jgi:hypothetical protein